VLLLAGCVPVQPAVLDYDWPAAWPDTTGTWVCPERPLEPRFEPTLFVATDGSDASDGRSPERPVATLARAARLARPGDVVWVREGTYAADVAFRTSGRPDAPIVFESHPGECAVLDGSGLDPLQRPRFESVRHVVFRNFVVRAAGIYLGGSDANVIAHVRVHGSATSGILSLGGDRNVFSHVITHDHLDGNGGGDADGISISSGNGNRIDRCLAYGNSDDGVDTWLSTRTLVERCVAFDNGRRDGDGNGFKAGGRGQFTGTVIRRSIAFDNRSDGFDANSGRNVRFDHATAVGNGRYGFVAEASVARNNLAVGNGDGPYPRRYPAAIEAGNSWSLPRLAAERVFASLDPRDRDFLALRADHPAATSGAPLADGADPPSLGAIPVGRRLEDLLGAPLAALTADAAP
jgi:parallel beta-helix repeat protein